MIQAPWCSELLANQTVAFKMPIPMPSVQETGKPKVESLKGKDVIVRLYDAMPANPSADDENLAPLREIYVFDEIVRTDEDGRFVLQPMVKVAVMVVDSMGEPVEGVPVKWTAGGSPASPVYNTDEDGIAWLNVPPNSRVSFVVDTQVQDQLFQGTLPYQIAGQEDNGATFIMTL